MNLRGVWTIYKFELARTWRTLFQSIFTPVLTPSLYFVVFGSAIGGRISEVGGVPYSAFIIPGLLLLTILAESTANASFGIFLPRFTGTIYELLSAPVGVAETLLGYVGAAVTKSVVLAIIILITARFFVDYHIEHPFMAAGFIFLSAAVSFLIFVLKKFHPHNTCSHQLISVGHNKRKLFELFQQFPGRYKCFIEGSLCFCREFR